MLTAGSESTYMFLGYIRVEAYMLLGDVHVPLQQDALEQPAWILGYNLLHLFKLEYLLYPLSKRDGGFALSKPRGASVSTPST